MKNRLKTDYSILRENMVRDLIVGRGIKDQKVVSTMGKIPRHLFVEEALAARAYGDYSLPIGEGQTISQPYMVALMTESLALQQADKVLEIGTGSGYQTAVLSSLCRRVYTVERIKSLGLRARRILSQLGCYNVLVRICDGSIGWPENILFDAIIVTASAPKVPESLLNQLSDGGRLIIPIGDDRFQRLRMIQKEDGETTQKDLTDCVFVKLIGCQGWEC